MARRIWPAALSLGIAAGLTGLGATGAQAGLELCNKTDALQSVAIGYKGDTDWTSEGWWNIKPGDCATLVEGDLTKRYYYYFTESTEFFKSQDFVFCTQPDVFTIIGDTDCDGRGFKEKRFREIDTGETATEFTLTMPEASLPVPAANAQPATSATGIGPGGGNRVMTGASSPDVGAAERDLTSGLTPGDNGAAFTINALFQGCELEEGRAFCSFHANGQKLRVFYGGPTPDKMLHTLEAMAVNTPVQVQGDRVGADGLQVAVVLRKVTPMPGSDPNAALRAAMQGDWLSEQDQRIGFTIHGSELYTRYDGDYRSARFMQLATTCDAARGAGPVLLQTKLKDGTTGCYIIERAKDGVLELTDPARGARLRYLADR